MSINPENAKPDQPYGVTVNGRRYTAQRVDPDDDLPWRVLKAARAFGQWKCDEEVSELVPLVPVRGEAQLTDSGVERLTAERDELQQALYSERSAHDATQREGRRFRDERDEARGVAARNTARWAEETAKVRELTAERDKLDRELSDVIEVTGSQYSELQAKLDDPYSEVNQKAAAWDRVEAHSIIGPLSSLPEGDSYAERVGKRLDQLADMEATINELQPAENSIVIGGKLPAWARPTLDREAVEAAIARWLAEPSEGDDDAAPLVDAIMSLTPAVEGWPDWLGPRPEKPSAFRTPSNFWSAGGRLIDREITSELCDERIRVLVERASAFAAVRDAIESEQAATGDEDQRVEEQAKELVGTILDFFNISDNDVTSRTTAQELVREVLDAGWTPPESEATA